MKKLNLIIVLLVLQINNLFGRYLSFDQDNDNKYCSDKLLCGKNAFINKPNEFDRVRELKPNQKAICEACDLAVPLVQKLISENKTEHFQSVVIFFCNEFKIEDPVVCDLVVKQYQVGLKYNL